MFVVVLAKASSERLEPIPGGARIDDEQTLSTTALYLNVVLSQALVGIFVLAVIWLTSVSRGAIGVTEPVWEPTLLVVGGIGLGIVLAVGNELSVHLLDRLDISYSDALRSSLAPSSRMGWVLLLLVVLPVIAFVEELLFRAALIGGLAEATGLAPWLLVVGSSVVFAIGHGLQGPGGILVTGALGLVLGGAFVVSESLLLVFVAHYVVNALEFLLHEGPGQRLGFGGATNASSESFDRSTAIEDG